MRFNIIFLTGNYIKLFTIKRGYILQNNKLLSISKIILALCIMLSLIWLGNSMQKLTNIQT